MTQRIEGSFDVKRMAHSLHEAAEGLLGRHALDKTYHGALSASGIGELVGLRGRMQIIIAEGKHSYVFECERS